MNRLKKMKSFAVSKKKAMKKVEIATACAEDDWIIRMEIYSEAKICPPYYCEIIIEKLNDPDKNVALRALKLLELCVRNCGTKFREQVAKHTMVQRLYRIMKGNNPEEVKKALYLSIGEWSYNEFANVPKLVLIPVLHYKLHPVWAGEKDEACSAVGKPPNISSLKHILDSPQASLIFKIFDEEDKHVRTKRNSQAASSSTHFHEEHNEIGAENAYLRELLTKLKLKYQRSDSESTDDEFDERDLIQKKKLQTKLKLKYQRSDSESSDDEFDEKNLTNKKKMKSLEDFQTSTTNEQSTSSGPKRYLSEMKLNFEFSYQNSNSESDAELDAEKLKKKAKKNLTRDVQSNTATNKAAPSSREKYLTKLKSTLECKICFDYMSTPIFICGYGHSICGSCRVHINKCPVCRAPISSRNFDLEELAKTFRALKITPSKTSK